jgi:hypothetical protein
MKRRDIFVVSAAVGWPTGTPGTGKGAPAATPRAQANPSSPRAMVTIVRWSTPTHFRTLSSLALLWSKVKLDIQEQ